MDSTSNSDIKVGPLTEEECSFLAKMFLFKVRRTERLNSWDIFHRKSRTLSAETNIRDNDQ